MMQLDQQTLILLISQLPIIKLCMNPKSKPKPKLKNQSRNPHLNAQNISELMEKAKAVQVQREKLLKAKCQMSLMKFGQSITSNKNPDSKPQQSTTISNIKKQHTTQVSNTKKNPPNQSLPIPQSASIQSSFRPFQSNRTLEPYLINIRQEYICGAAVNKHQQTQNQQISNHNYVRLTTNQNEKNDKKKQQPLQPVSNSESIQLSESREVSQQMLLHNSVTSKFLQSPTLSLGLVESKITKKEADSEKNSKILKKKQLISNDFETGQILFTTNNNNQNKVAENEQNKQSIRFYQQLIKSFHDHQHQQQQAMKKIQLKEVSQQFPQHSIVQDPRENLNTQVIEGKSYCLPLMDADFGNSIMASYQMEVEYLRKINLYQSFEIEKLRKLIRISESEHQRSVSTNHHQSCHQATQAITDKPSTNPQFKKAIDILKRRQTINFQKKQLTSTLNQLEINLKNTSADQTELQFICGDYSTELINHNNKRSISFTTNNQTTSESFHPNKKASYFNKRNSKKPTAKPKQRALSISDKHNISYNYQNDQNPLNYKSQSLNMSAQQMMSLSINNKHNLSCSTYFVGTKSIKKSGKCKTSHSERNLSTIVSSGNNKENNKENFVPTKNSVKFQKKRKMNRKGSILEKDVEMFVSTKKREGHLGAMIKKKR